MSTPAFSVRDSEIVGTKYRQYFLIVGGVCIHSQISPYSDAEISERISKHIRPQATQKLKPDNWHSRPGRPSSKTAAAAKDKYDWRDGDIE